MSLVGDNKKPLFDVDIQISLDECGNFLNVVNGDKTYSINEWNKIIQDGFQ